MAQHKAATAVTIAPTEEKSAFASFVDTWWKLGLGIALVVSVTVLWIVWRQQQQIAASDQSWTRLFASIDIDMRTLRFDADPEKLRTAIEELEGTDAAPWALFLLAQNLFTEGDYDESLAAIQRFRQEYPQHSLARSTYSIPGQPGQETVLDRMQKLAEAQKKWEETYGWVLKNPELPADAPRVRIVTEKGPIVVGLYQELAPEHCANFLKLCGEAYYDDTLFHRVVRDQIVQGGDPNTKEEDKTKWGFGGPEYKIEYEDAPVWHFRGYLAAAKTANEVKSSGSQFYFTVGDMHTLDGQHVVFGKVLDGMDLVDEMSEAELDDSSRDRPREPVKIVSTEVL